MGSMAASRPAPTIHGWALPSCIVGLTLAVNLGVHAVNLGARLPSCIVGLTLAVNLGAVLIHIIITSNLLSEKTQHNFSS
jgi:hypothetical protein